MTAERANRPEIANMYHARPAPIVFYSARTASISLYLDGLSPDISANIRVLAPGRPQDDLAILGRAGLVVYVRGFEAVARSGLDDALERAAVPRTWFTDDDLGALCGEQPGFRFYRETHLAQFASRMAALVGTTPALCARLSILHPRVFHWPIVLDKALLPEPVVTQGGPLRIAAFGGPFRAEGFRHVGLPAISAIPGSEVIVSAGLHPPTPRVRVIPFEPDFQAFLQCWRSLQPDVVLHPPGRSANMPMKGPGALLVALYLNAAPVVADEPAFAGLGAEQGVERVPDEPEAWRAALIRLADPRLRAARLARLRTHCCAAYPAMGAASAIHGLLDLARGRQAASLAPLRDWRPRIGWRLVTRLRSLSSHFGVRRQ